MSVWANIKRTSKNFWTLVTQSIPAIVRSRNRQSVTPPIILISLSLQPPTVQPWSTIPFQSGTTSYRRSLNDSAKPTV